MKKGLRLGGLDDFRVAHARTYSLMKKGLRLHPDVLVDHRLSQNIFPDEEGIKTYPADSARVFMGQNIFPDEEGIKTQIYPDMLIDGGARTYSLMKKGLRP